MRNRFVIVLVLLFSVTAQADEPLAGAAVSYLEGSIAAPAAAEAQAAAAPAQARPKPESALGGMCIGMATRCGLLPKGICFMQSGCFNPMVGDRCDGTARYCTHFTGKSACMMQRGCTWAKN